MSKETFCVGDSVDWDDKKEDSFPKMIHLERVKKYGAGPFEIIKVKNVPTDVCSCGMVLYDHSKYYSLELLEMIDGPHHTPYGCPYGYSQTMRESVGHHQWVVIKGKDGIIRSSFSGGPQEWSGSWFKKVKPSTDATPAP